jgi:hypothetical protein
MSKRNINTQLNGLHLFNEAVGKEGDIVNTGTIHGTRRDYTLLKYTEYNQGRWFESKDITPYYRELTEMTEKEKQEFANLFFAGCTITKVFHRVTTDQLEVEFVDAVHLDETPVCTPLTHLQYLWLVIHGFRVGQERLHPGYKQKPTDYKPGDRVLCPTCGAPGRYDPMTSNVNESTTATYSDAVFFNTHTNLWECHDCWLK